MQSIRSLAFRVISRSPVPFLLVLALLVSAPAARAACGNGVVEPPLEQCDDGSQNGTTNSCCTNLCLLTGKNPDVIVGDVTGTTTYNAVGGIAAYAFGTTSCNLGSCWLNWFSGTAEHPVIGQNMYRLKNGRFEQIGQSWLKHGFTALAGNVCSSSCVTPPDGTHLGINCSDPYGSSLNGQQDRLGPKVDVNPFSGVYPYPDSRISTTGNAIFKRLQVHTADVDPAQNAGALYFVEGQYVTHDDATAKANTNNASYRTASVTGGAPNYAVSLTGSTQRQKAGIQAWKATDATVTEQPAFVASDGFFVVSAKATSLGGGVYHYEYAVQNLTSDRSGQSFSVPVPATATVTNIGFHDVDYHSGEPFSGTDWTSSFAGGAVTWSTQTFAQNVNANALRWGTLYNFRFDANVAPSTGNITIGLFKPGSPASITQNTVAPAPCAAVETCGNAVDDDCDGATDCADAECCTSATCAASDADGDHFAAVCDCNDSNPTVYPGAPQLCDGINNNCSAAGWPAVPANEADADGDGVRICGGDCDDANPARYPGNVEACDGIDNDCVGGVPANEVDADGDGVRICGGDCDDANPARYPGNAEVCDGVDNDCVGGVPADEADADGDGMRICGGDCDDTNPARFAGNPEICDGLDNNCDGFLPPEENDEDGDGVIDCQADCDPANAAVWATPGEVRNLMVALVGGVTTLTWDPPASTGCVTPRYDTIRSTDPADFVVLGECVEWDGTDLETIDPVDPAPGSVQSYLIRAKNDCPNGEGSLGNESGFVPRTGRPCP